MSKHVIVPGEEFARALSLLRHPAGLTQQGGRDLADRLSRVAEPVGGDNVVALRPVAGVVVNEDAGETIDANLFTEEKDR